MWDAKLVYLYITTFIPVSSCFFSELNTVATHRCLTRFSAVPAIKPVRNNVGVGYFQCKAA